ncbi:atherin-like [Dermochelys coriacea]|uniref:atherin-like n=1 Tax=Dermochelys coriacea TaxID=27794 RepID=UPI001CA9E4D0|nr:atherin-like [Dermochelys coriacea]
MPELVLISPKTLQGNKKLSSTKGGMRDALVLGDPWDGDGDSVPPLRVLGSVSAPPTTSSVGAQGSEAPRRASAGASRVVRRRLQRAPAQRVTGGTFGLPCSPGDRPVGASPRLGVRLGASDPPPLPPHGASAPPPAAPPGPSDPPPDSHLLPSPPMGTWTHPCHHSKPQGNPLNLNDAEGGRCPAGGGWRQVSARGRVKGAVQQNLGKLAPEVLGTCQAQIPECPLGAEVTQHLTGSSMMQ